MPWLRTAESEGAREQGSKTARANALWRFAVPKVLRMDFHATDEDLFVGTQDLIRPYFLASDAPSFPCALVLLFPRLPAPCH
jgi:hypothetical protein